MSRICVDRAAGSVVGRAGEPLIALWGTKGRIHVSRFDNWQSSQQCHDIYSCPLGQRSWDIQGGSCRSRRIVREGRERVLDGPLRSSFGNNLLHPRLSSTSDSLNPTATADPAILQQLQDLHATMLEAATPKVHRTGASLTTVDEQR